MWGNAATIRNASGGVGVPCRRDVVHGSRGFVEIPEDEPRDSGSVDMTAGQRMTRKMRHAMNHVRIGSTVIAINPFADFAGNSTSAIFVRLTLYVTKHESVLEQNNSYKRGGRGQRAEYRCNATQVREAVEIRQVVYVGAHGLNAA